MSTIQTTAEIKSEESDSMGVASLSANKRRLENPDVGDEDYVAAKVAKKTVGELSIESSGVPAEVQDTIIGSENNSDFLATSILARTLLTSTGGGGGGCGGVSNHCSPLESLCSTLEALPAPSLLLDGTDDIRSTFLSTFKTTIHETTDLEFNSLLCHERSLSTVTVLSPIDEDGSDWSSHHSAGTSATNSTTTVVTVRKPSKVSAGLSSSGSSLLLSSNSSSNGDQVITEDETGKSYYNLGSADTTISVKKSPTLAASSTPPPVPTMESGDGGGWISSCNSSMNNNAGDFHDDNSSSSCESISSEDLFTSEEFDASEDEEEIRSYKQQRSTVLHLSLCKLNSFRTQCVEPSLHRSVLICNTLRHIEQEIRNEDEIPARAPQPLPPFWGSQHLHNNNNNNNPGPVNGVGGGGGGGIPPVNINPNMNQPQITDVRPNGNPSLVASMHGHDPYLTPNTYPTSPADSSPYSISYDYSSLRPHPTPFHTASYEYEQDLPLVSSSPATAPTLMDVSSPPSLLECDSGYAEDLNMSSYYYNTPPRSALSSHPGDGVSSPGSSNNSNASSSPTGSTSPPGNTSYLNCGYSSLTIGDSPVCTSTANTDSLLSDSSLLPSPTSDMSDIEIHNSLNLPPPTTTSTVESSRSNCDYMNNTSSGSSINCSSSSSSSSGSTSPTHSTSSSSSSSSSDSSESENSVSPPPSSLIDNSSSRSGSSSTSNLCWSNKLCPPGTPPAIRNMVAMNKEIISSDSSLLQQKPTTQLSQQHPSFVSQESHQCGMESRLTEFNRSHSNFNNPHHHNLPMDSLISANYTDSL